MLITDENPNSNGRRPVVCSVLQKKLYIAHAFSHRRLRVYGVHAIDVATIETI